MTEDEFDYQKLGFKSGLEIHQQLDTNKLFCNCPSVLRMEEPDFSVKRKLHAVAGEGGEIDIAARHEAEKDKEFIYQGYDSVCLVELDEEPPHQINSEALKIALRISLLLNAKILPITQIMRKTVINGSNTSGFQRTVLIAKDGYVETESGRVGIEGIALEEDAAREISKQGKIVVFRLDRLGIPLVEIVTAPDIKSPEQAKEVALHIGDILRSCKVKRGLGTIRQDVNMSIKRGARMEIKGVQNPDLIVKTINFEIKRQINLIGKARNIKPEVRNALANGETEFLRPLPGAARMYPETDLPLLKISRQMINEAKKTLPKLRKEVEKDLAKTGLNQEMLNLLLQERMLDEFNALLKLYNNPNLIVKALILWKKEIAKRENLSEKKMQERLSVDIIESIIGRVVSGKIKERDIRGVMQELARGKSIAEAVKFEKQDNGAIEEKIMKIIKEKPGLSPNAYMGLVMKEFQGKIDAREVMEIIKKYVK
ncbi:aspartyl/glutamyl-tRNA(Asn/Gln) amidotransferase subunit B [archaeon BMS3Abin17]|nr:aspartyl/glutamyl-tRNA(Asn/Gln) amidotransferase subunit B [archaeon BMS3Abin17]HDZ60638.1 Glu-tRNA(Gln) amidotransferase subunit GatE [Candidatus Pacearchaeota archaeon]